jgi:hypothetical protein
MKLTPSLTPPLHERLSSRHGHELVQVHLARLGVDLRDVVPRGEAECCEWEAEERLLGIARGGGALQQSNHFAAAG